MRCSTTCPNYDKPERVCNPIRGQHIQETAGGTNVSTRAFCAFKRATTVATLLDLGLRGQIGQRYR